MNTREILALLKSLGWTVTQLAAALHVNEITVRRWLKGVVPRHVYVIAMRRLQARLERQAQAKSKEPIAV